jgi:uncharacterized protein (DUF1778 family)
MYSVDIHNEHIKVRAVMTTTTTPKALTLRVTDKQYAELKKAAELTGLTLSALVRMCLNAELQNLKDKYACGE